MEKRTIYSTLLHNHYAFIVITACTPVLIRTNTPAAVWWAVYIYVYFRIAITFLGKANTEDQHYQSASPGRSLAVRSS
jgi:hypothetical protein